MRQALRPWPDQAAALALPVLAGLAWMAWAGAPPAYLAVNLASLVLALAAAVWLPLPRRENRGFALALGAVALLWLTALAGAESEGVRRWIALGPVRLHTGYLVLPLVVTLASRLPGWRAAILLAAAALATLVQPDRATCFALAAAATVIALQRQERFSIAALAATLLAAGLVLRQSDPLQPVRFVEAVQANAFALQPLAGAILVLVTFAPLLLARRHNRAAYPLAAFMMVAALCAFAGAYPSILIGYGAAPILGFGLALAALRVK